MDLKAIVETIKELETCNRLYAEARTKNEKYGFWIQKIAHLQIKLADLGIPIEITENTKRLNEYYIRDHSHELQSN